MIPKRIKQGRAEQLGNNVKLWLILKGLFFLVFKLHVVKLKKDVNTHSKFNISLN